MVELSKTPATAEQLARLHPPVEVVGFNGALYCGTCTTPGRGTLRVRFPCSLRILADTAIKVAKSRDKR